MYRGILGSLSLTGRRTHKWTRIDNRNGVFFWDFQVWGPCKHICSFTLLRGFFQSGEDPIDAAYRFDKKMLKRLISTCSEKDIAVHCKSRVDGIFLARDLCNGYSMSSVDTFREVTGILPFMDGKCKPRPSAPMYPTKGSPKYKKNIDKLSFDSKSLKAMYPDQPRCAVWLFPYIQFKVIY